MSKNEIEQIEEDIVKLADNRELTHECAFDLGVRLGRFLEKNWHSPNIVDTFHNAI